MRKRHLFWIAIFSLFTTTLLYSYFVQATISNIVARKTIEYEISQLGSLLGDRDAEYIAIRDTITREYAQSLGFFDTKNKTFTRRKRLVQN